MRNADLDIHEEDFIDDYCRIAGRNHTALKGHYFRRMFPATGVEGIRFKAWVFSSATDAKRFDALVEETAGWQQRDNRVFHATPEDMDLLENVSRKTIDR